MQIFGARSMACFHRPPHEVEQTLVDTALKRLEETRQQRVSGQRAFSRLLTGADRSLASTSSALGESRRQTRR
jgi:hypothetical protein